MQGQHLQMMEDMLRFTGLVMLTGGAIASTRPSPAVSVAPAPVPVATILPATGKQVEKKRRDQEVEEFAKLPTHIQRQALGYARKWTESFFEPLDTKP